MKPKAVSGQCQEGVAKPEVIRGMKLGWLSGPFADQALWMGRSSSAFH